MARIRTVKPDLLRHEGLYELEAETKLPVRIAFVGMFLVADREGRFVWNPRVLKLDILPFDDIDFSRVLDALASRSFIVKYVSYVGLEHGERRFYGYIPNFKKHQVINNKEGPSKLPDPQIDCEILPYESPDTSRTPRVHHATVTPLNLTQGEGKRKGREKEGKGNAENSRVRVSDGDADAVLKKSASLVIGKFCELWKAKYKTSLDFSQAWAGNAKTLVKGHGLKRSLELAESFLEMNDKWFVDRRHSFDLILTNLAKISHYAGTGAQITQTQLNHMDQSLSNMNSGEAAADFFLKGGEQ